jgi:1-acyl-sn-glycerol-3-phosphate acyltransferase
MKPPSKLQSIWYYSVRILMRFLFFVLTDYKITGRENIPDDRPLIVTINHISAIDLPAMMVVLPFQPVAFAASTHKTGVYGMILRQFNVIFVRRGEVDRQALRQALEHLENGGVLGLAPEGTRSPTKTMIRAKPGGAFLALRTNAIILPIGVIGTETLLRAWKRLRRPKIRAVIGKPYRLEAPVDGKPDLQALGDEMMLRIAELVPPAYRGVYAGWENRQREAKVFAE